MSQRIVPVLAIAGFLAACGGNPLLTGSSPTPNPNPGTGGTTVTVPASVAGTGVVADLASWDAGAATITVNLNAQDANSLNATYTRNPALDVGGYQAYTYQETSSNRFVVALVREVGDLTGLIAVDGGQFANYFGGGTYARIDTFIAPTAGVGAAFNYSGTYVGMLNAGIAVPGPGGVLDPTQAYRTTGEVLVTADFTNMSVSGAIDNRTIVDTGFALPSIALFATSITAQGTFEGDVYRLDPDGWTAAGDYAGLFGSDVNEIAALLVFNPISGQSELFEHGLIVLPSCATVGGPNC